MNFNNTILALDTTLYSSSVSLLHHEKTYSLFKLCVKNHENKILNMIKKILNKANITLNNIDYITCTIGPGSFTGIRISIGISQTISIIYRIPIIGFSTLQILSEQSWKINKIKRVLIAIQISKNQIFWAKYIKNKIGLWVGGYTEKLFKNINIIKKKIMKCSGVWSAIGLNIHTKNLKKSIKLFYTHITTPHSKDIISCAIKYLKYYKYSPITQIYPRYLHTIR
ncbi:tRNA threonylcarbamoyladenosine biosynthesis protein TsaB [Buchnera aphidicola (Cinara kochiana kochiana)]|uniref:tRNA threonylcarbamoyladenosine biosynthesis protein TsaB n=1 Tax=Buchnera aphidicola (Cinara kochiana kochiana) TaxID=2518976 RepID=A0A451D5N5_9GAMM|nr:tRNA (adenosine(37)-N6)-threonylcarbamoyltransferase complex dimerization subunit type 1 TsaB [Buchnera aphidicola]VFP81126.1 tRNA threonylcarbamoyladenosine biosynthesis protein TsaB [Buchnera aphidicola (Cinara kochiana kochiana)]